MVLVSCLPSELTEHTTDRLVLGASTVGLSEPGSIASGGSGIHSTPSGLQSTVDPDAGLALLQEIAPNWVDSNLGLHPFSVNRFDAGPV